MKITRTEIYKSYRNQIDDVHDDEKKEKLLDMLEDVDTMLLELEGDIDEAIEEQESDYLPSYQEQHIEAMGTLIEDFFTYNGR